MQSIIAAESGFDHNATSPDGAVGLMQLMPETAEELGWDPTDPVENIQAGTEYIGFLIERYRKKPDGLHWAIAAYNAGPGNVERYRGVPPFKETRAYVKRVLGYYAGFRRTGPRSRMNPWINLRRLL